MFLKPLVAAAMLILPLLMLGYAEDTKVPMDVIAALAD